ncbi:MAG: hypothetical protein QF768_13385 [Candidatus Latescibacteria bacterium]|jgi:uroporphyrinogen decarboxylase|nr:hypothetical protein [Candidatus Latescibacterota bacterium]
MTASSEMTHRERTLAVLRYEPYDRLPIVHFGFWSGQTPQKWASEGHISNELAEAWTDGNAADMELGTLLGFDFNWQCMFGGAGGLSPGFESRVVKEFADGTRHVLNGNGVVIVHKPEAGSIPAEIDHLLKDRASYEEHYSHRLQWQEERITRAQVVRVDVSVPWDQGGLEILRASEWDTPYGLHCGSLYGEIRNLLGLEGACYLQVDDESLFDEIIDTVAELSYQKTQFILEAGARFDFGHFWEDISFKNGPLISPRVFAEKVGPHYRRITNLMASYGIDIVSVDSDGCIDALVPTWFENGVNTMFPIEVGTWDASIEPWRQQFGRDLRGVGGMNKNVLSRDRAAVDAEIDRLKPLVALGGYIPCPDHRLALDAKWELVCYYTERLREVFA